MADRALIARELAAFLLAGAWTKGRVAARAGQYLGREAPRALQRLVDHVFASVKTPYPPAPDDLARALLASDAFDIAARRALRRPLEAVLHSPAFAPAPALAGLPVPRLETPGDLAAWLELPMEQVDWLADVRRGHARAASPQLHHYSTSSRPSATARRD